MRPPYADIKKRIRKDGCSITNVVGRDSKGKSFFFECLDMNDAERVKYAIENYAGRWLK